MSQKGQAHFKNLEAIAVRYSKCVWPFWDIMRESVQSNILLFKNLNYHVNQINQTKST